MSQQPLADIKWRKRMCEKWQEEMKMKQAEAEALAPKRIQVAVQESPQPVFAVPSVPARVVNVPPKAAPSRAASVPAGKPKTNMETFLEDPLSMKKLFLPQCVVHHLVGHRNDYRRIMKSCFVRVNVDRCFGPPRYRVAQIDGYAGRTRAGCDAQLQLLLRIDDEKPEAYTIQCLANAYFEPNELLQWQCLWQKCKLSLPSKHLIEQKYKVIIIAKEQLLRQVPSLHLSHSPYYRNRTAVTCTTTTTTATTTTSAIASVTKTVQSSKNSSLVSVAPIWQSSLHRRLTALEPPKPPRLINRCGPIPYTSFMHTPMSLAMSPQVSNKRLPKPKPRPQPFPKLTSMPLKIPLAMSVPAPTSIPIPAPAPAPVPEPMPLKKRISLAEYRKRRVMEFPMHFKV